jgi:hypothetical protein
MATPESIIKKSILHFLYTKKNVSVFPVATTGMFDPTSRRFRKTTGRIGTPDILCCIGGKFLALEVKSETGKLSESQRSVLKDIERCGGVAKVVRSIDEVRTILLDIERSLVEL